MERETKYSIWAILSSSSYSKQEIKEEISDIKTN